MTDKKQPKQGDAKAKDKAKEKSKDKVKRELSAEELDKVSGGGAPDSQHHAER
jgi:hypothetical protein